MDSATLALWGVGALWALFAAWVWISYRFMENASKIHGILHELHDMNGDALKNLESRLDAMQVVHDEDVRVLQKACAVGPVERRVEELEKIKRILLAADKQNVAYLNKLDDRVAGVEALLVSTVGQETEDFCRQMDALFEKMDEPKPEPKKPEQAEKLTLSQEYCGKFGKKGKK